MSTIHHGISGFVQKFTIEQEENEAGDSSNTQANVVQFLPEVFALDYIYEGLERCVQDLREFITVQTAEDESYQVAVTLGQLKRPL